MYNESAAVYCNYNAINGRKVVCVINNHTQHQHQHQPESTYLPDHSMDISLFSYMYTLFLAFGCYSFLNPEAARMIMLNTLVSLAKYTITGYGIFKDHVYKPYVKYVHPKLLRLLHIDDGVNEVIVIKNGKVIHSFKTMELFVKNNPIKFVKEFSDDDDTESEEDSQEEEQDESQENTSQDNPNPSESLSDKVDYNKKCEQLNDLIEAFKMHTLDDKPSDGQEQHEQQHAQQHEQHHQHQQHEDNTETHDSETSEDTDNTHEENDDIPDDYILDPTAYDFIIRNFYYQNEKTGETHSYVFKYDVFYKSEMHEKYDVNMVKEKYLSSRKFIGISLKTNNLKYAINLTTLNNYYISDNSIFNYSFMKWYMMKHYNVKLSNDYVISCIDNYVEMYKINPGKKILVNKNRFEILDDETFVNEDSETQNDHDDDGGVDEDEHDSQSDTGSETAKNDTKESKDAKENKSSNAYLEDNHEMCDIEILDYD
jgi:hypothetical protein